ncbi:MAG: hypothetical protein FJZ90_11965 [Chloroflexi bacterium]|nr:hypothetical protein [Chloroflexota bacterium]
MEKRFRALRAVAVLYRILAWVVLALGAIGSLLVVIVGAIQGRVGSPSPLLADVPGINQVTGLVAGLLAGILLLVFTLLQFLLLYAASEAIQVGLAIEHNTRETAYYLKGEGALSASPVSVSWEAGRPDA